MPTTGRLEAPGVSRRFLDLVAGAGLDGRRVLDVGCGRGRLTLALAPHALHTTGIDRDPAQIAEARRRAVAAGVTRVAFEEADADREDYGRFAPDLVTAHLFCSDAMIARAGRALPRGGHLLIAAFHVDQWRETGRPSRFAYDEARLARRLEAAGLLPDVLEVETEVRRFESVEEGLAAALDLRERWESDGRWPRYVAFLEAGGRTLTRSHLLVRARRS